MAYVATTAVACGPSEEGAQTETVQGNTVIATVCTIEQSSGPEEYGQPEPLRTEEATSDEEVNEDFQKGKSSIAIQVNDYEIERRSSTLPARRRFIPFKFRDFHDPDIVTKEEPDDDYDPSKEFGSSLLPKRGRKKGQRGRPRRMRQDHSYEKAGDGKSGDTGVSEDGKSTEDGGDGDPQSEDTKPEQNDETEKSKHTKGSRRGRPPKGCPTALPKVFKCLTCNKKFSQKGNLKVHMRTHTGEKPFPCDFPECGKNFRCNETLKRHKLAHLGIKLYECEICKRRFSASVALKEHMDRHTDSRPHVCEYCNRSFRQVSCLRRHLLTHSDEKPFACDQCGQKFSQLVYLRSHYRSHTGEKPFVCKTCGRGFAYHSDLNRHQTVHSGTKPYACTVCSARFSDPSSRRRHVKEHEGFKPYTCQLCGDMFKRSGQLKAHLSKKHMNYKEDVVISKEGPFNAMQFEFKTGSALTQAQQEANQAAMQEAHQIIIQEDGSAVLGNQQSLHLIASAAANLSPVSQITDRNAQQIILQTNATNQEELMQQTQHIIQQIQSQLENSNCNPGEEVQLAYQVLHDDEDQQILEIQYQTVGDMQTVGDIQTIGEVQMVGEVQTGGDIQSVEEVHEVGEVQTVGGVQPGHIVTIGDPQTVHQMTITDELQVQEEELAIEDTEAVTHEEIMHSQQVTEEQEIVSQDERQKMQNMQHNEHEEQIAHVKLEQRTLDNQTTEHENDAQVEYNEQTENHIEHVQIKHIIDDAQLEDQPLDDIEEKEEITQVDEHQVQQIQYQVQILEEEEEPEPGAEEVTIEVEPNEILPQEPVEQNTLQSQQEEMLSQHNQMAANNLSMESGIPETERDSTEHRLAIQQSVASGLDFVTKPDFNSQDYYNWLSNFTELCKLVHMPLDVNLFQKISQVLKTLSDVLAWPSGILTNKENFRTLMNISAELNTIINEHLAFVLQNLDPTISTACFTDS